MNTLITGASSGIGEALALECARRGDSLFICGRNALRLAAVEARCRALLPDWAFVHAKVLDITDLDATAAWLRECDAAAPLERVFSNAGIATGSETDTNVRATFATNVTANMNVVLVALELMRRRKAANPACHAQILITASIAGYSALPTCPAYSATKSCMKTWALALRGMLGREGIMVSAICPGFVRSRITDRNTCPMPFFMEADKAARIILRRAARNAGLIAFPWPMRLAAWLLSCAPQCIAEFISRALPPKA